MDSYHSATPPPPPAPLNSMLSEIVFCEHNRAILYVSKTCFSFIHGPNNAIAICLLIEFNCTVPDYDVDDVCLCLLCRCCHK